MKIVFIGASSFGYKCLSLLHAEAGVELTGVISNSEKFSISYNKEGVTNVLYQDFSKFTSEHKLPFYKMKDNMKEEALLSFIEKAKPDLIVVIGWYHIIPAIILQKYQCIGFHASLLPDYSGGAPLVWAIINGETKTGITLFKFDLGIDSGDIIGQAEVSITSTDTIKTLYEKIEILGLDLLLKHLPDIIKGQVMYTPQNEAERRVFRQRRPEDGLIDWSWNPQRIKDFIRAQTKPYPGAFTIIQGKKVIIWDADIVNENSQ